MAMNMYSVFWHSFVTAFGEGCTGSAKLRQSGTTKPIYLPPWTVCAFWMWPFWVGLGPSSCCLPSGLCTILDNDLQKDLLALILNSPLVIFAWCPWYKPRTLYQTILPHCWNSHLPPSTLLNPWCAKAPAKNHNTSQQGLCANRTKQPIPASVS